MLCRPHLIPPLQPQLPLAARFVSFPRQRTYEYASSEKLAKHTRQEKSRLTELRDEMGAFSFRSDNLEDTLRLGQVIGGMMRGGEVIELTSDLGGGKTALTKGIAAGMHSEDVVQSPTFTISRIYRCKNNLELHHFDFYRLEDPGIMAAELAESLNDEQVVVVIEWSKIVKELLPESRVQIVITATGETSREFKLTVPESMAGLARVLQELR